MHSRLLALGLLIGVLLGGMLLLSHPGMQDQSPASSQSPASPSAADTPLSNTPGIPAIVPHLLSPTAATGAASRARFTVSDVKAYLSAHPFPSGPVVPGASATILAIDFMTSQQASQRLHGESIGLPDRALVCYVTLHGPFTLKHIQQPPGAAPLPPVSTGVEVFDTQTGNLLLWWVPSPTSPTQV